MFGEYERMNAFIFLIFFLYCILEVLYYLKTQSLKKIWSVQWVADVFFKSRIHNSGNVLVMKVVSAYRTQNEKY